MSKAPAQQNPRPAFVVPNPPFTPARKHESTNTGHAAPHNTVAPLLETPLRPKDGETTAVTVNNLSGKRRAAIEDAGDIHPEVSLENFFEYLLPLRKCLKQHNVVDTVVEKLKEGSDALLKHDPATDSFVWLNVLSKQAANAKEKELFTTLDEIARRIEGIVGGLSNELGETLEPVVQYKDAPSKAPQSFNRTSGHIPDGYFTLRQRQEPGSADYWVDIGVVGEFKKGKSRKDTNKDVRQIIWDMHHMLQEDERRRFTIGFTIEGRSMRLWYVSRADIFISEDFDFMASPEHLVQFFLAATFSYEHQLGWDPTMKYVAATGNTPRHLLISARSPDGSSTMLFKTLELLSNIGTEAIRGRGTRVWRVEGLSQNGKPLNPRQAFVLKDNWIDSDRAREGAINQAIRKSAELIPENGKKVLLNALLTVKIYGDVWIDQEYGAGVEQGFYDSTFTDEQREKIWPAGSPCIRLQRPAIDDATEEQITTVQSQARGNPHSAFEKQLHKNLVRYDAKTHSRIVFYETCKPIHDEPSLQKVCTTLAAATTALKALHLAGWVHRDISSGNILLCRNQVKIADLEFAKEFKEMITAGELEDVRFHNVRTGTPRYTPLEAGPRRFLFTGIADQRTRKAPEAVQLEPGVPLAQQEIDFFVPVVPVEANVEYDLVDAVPKPTLSAKPEPTKVIWQYHPIHDLESLSWLSEELTINRDLYFASAEYPDREVYAPEGGETVDQRCERIKRQAEAADFLRPSNPLRSQCLIAEDFLVWLTETMHPMLRRDPPPGPRSHESCSVATALEKIRSSIYNKYVTASADPSKITHLVALDIYGPIAEALDKASHSLMITHYIPSIRPLEKEVHTVMKQDGVKDIVQSAQTAVTKKSKGKAKEVPQVTQSEASTAANTRSATAKRKRETSTREADPQPGSSKNQAPPEELPTQAPKKRKTTARKTTTRKTTTRKPTAKSKS